MNTSGRLFSPPRFLIFAKFEIHTHSVSFKLVLNLSEDVQTKSVYGITQETSRIPSLLVSRPICHRRLALFACQKTSEVLSGSQNNITGNSRPDCSPVLTHMWRDPCCSCFCAPARAPSLHDAHGSGGHATADGIVRRKH